MDAIKNPFAESMRKNGYSVTIHYPPYEKRKTASNKEIVEQDINMIKQIILDKTNDMSIEQLNDYMTKIFDAIKDLIS